LGRLGVNVNQIARATNASRRVQPEMAAVLEATVRVCGRIEGFLDDVDSIRRPAGQGERGGVG
jgi:Bacterial mobilisation protein (MobC)